MISRCASGSSIDENETEHQEMSLSMGALLNEHDRHQSWVIYTDSQERSHYHNIKRILFGLKLFLLLYVLFVALLILYDWINYDESMKIFFKASNFYH